MTWERASGHLCCISDSFHHFREKEKKEKKKVSASKRQQAIEWNRVDR